MAKFFLLLILVAVMALNVGWQSGRRNTAPRSSGVPPIQPPINPEPEPVAKPAMVAPAILTFLPESLRERQISALDSGSFRFADFSGRVVVINLWASWCGPCRREVPEYEKVRKAFAERQVEFIGLTVEDPRTSSARVKQFVRDVNFSFRIGWADRDMARTLTNGRSSIPQTLVVDAEGRIVDHWVGYGPGRGGQKLAMAIEHALQIAPVPVPQ